MLLIILLYMLLASTFTIAKAVLLYAQPVFFIGIRMILGGGLLLCYTYFFRNEWLKFTQKHWPLFLQIIIFHIYLAYTLEFVALKTISSAKACLLYNLSPFITALFAYLFYAEHMNKKKCLGLIVGFIGFIPILMSTAPAEGVTLFYLSWSEILLLFSVICAVQGWMVMKRLSQLGYSPIFINGTGMLLGGILALITAFFCELPPYIFATTGSEWLLFVLYTASLILIANIIFYNLYGYLLHYYSATFLAFAGFTSPLFAALYGQLFLGERQPIWFFVSVFIIFLGLFLFYQEELKSKKI
ncbi:MAG TPA: DMT family transporter [Candidatus Babeliales bacterium]|nr:DMT family transporter [Candidatus Babeliales bacterium]